MVAVVGVVLGLALVAVGVLGVRHARTISRLSEQLDAIGSTTSLDEVAPAGWKVSLNRLLFATVAGGGVVVVALALLD